MKSNNSPSIKKNFVYKSLLTISNYLMAFITFPYISRILGVENIGLVNFVDNTINYFILFATLGVNVLGTREIAKVKSLYEKRSNVFSNILGMNILFSGVVLLVYILSVKLIPIFDKYSTLFYIGISKILFVPLLLEWLFSGLEEFKYITIRSLITKMIYICSVFIFVKNPSDFKLYFLLTVSVTIINSLINVLYARKFVKFNLKECFKLSYVKQNITLGIYQIMTSMYITFNVLCLGLLTNNIQVGYYTTAFKLYTVILGLFSAFTNVMLPRMSCLIANNDKTNFVNLFNKSYSIVLFIAFPLMICSIILAPEIIYVISGPGYEGAIVPMRIIMPAILFVAISQVLAIQILIPLNKERILLYISIIGASISLIFNFLFVRKYQSEGSALVLVLSEFIIMLAYIIYVKINTDFRLTLKPMLQSLCMSMPSAVLCLLLPRLINNIYISFFTSIIVAILAWLLLFTLFSKSAKLEILTK